MRQCGSPSCRGTSSMFPFFSSCFADGLFSTEKGTVNRTKTFQAFTSARLPRPISCRHATPQTQASLWTPHSPCISHYRLALRYLLHLLSERTTSRLALLASRTRRKELAQRHRHCPNPILVDISELLSSA